MTNLADCLVCGKKLRNPKYFSCYECYVKYGVLTCRKCEKNGSMACNKTNGAAKLCPDFMLKVSLKKP